MNQNSSGQDQGSNSTSTVTNTNSVPGNTNVSVESGIAKSSTFDSTNDVSDDIARTETRSEIQGAIQGEIQKVSSPDGHVEQREENSMPEKESSGETPVDQSIVKSESVHPDLDGPTKSSSDVPELLAQSGEGAVNGASVDGITVDIEKTEPDTTELVKTEPEKTDIEEKGAEKEATETDRNPAGGEETDKSGDPPSEPEQEEEKSPPVGKKPVNEDEGPVNAINDPVSPVIAAFAQSASEREQVQFEEYQARLNDHVVRATRWQERCATLKTALSAALTDCLQKLLEAKNLFETIREEVRTKLAGRQKVLDIVTKQLGMLEKNMHELQGEMPPTPVLKRITVEEWNQLLSDVSEEKAEEKIRAELTRLEGEYWEVLSVWRTVATKNQSRFKDFVTSYVLRPMDGLFDGEPITSPIVEDLKKEYPTVAKHLRQWLQSYRDCMDRLSDALMEGHVHPIDVGKGTMFDADNQEPVDTEADPNMKDGEIKEIFRIGYRVDEDGVTIDRIRRTQVIVVKNG